MLAKELLDALLTDGCWVEQCWFECEKMDKNWEPPHTSLMKSQQICEKKKKLFLESSVWAAGFGWIRDVNPERRNMTTKETALFILLLLRPYSTPTFSSFSRGETAFQTVSVSCMEKNKRDPVNLWLGFIRIEIWMPAGWMRWSNCLYKYQITVKQWGWGARTSAKIMHWYFSKLFFFLALGTIGQAIFNEFKW